MLTKLGKVTSYVSVRVLEAADLAVLYFFMTPHSSLWPSPFQFQCSASSYWPALVESPSCVVLWQVPAGWCPLLGSTCGCACCACTGCLWSLGAQGQPHWSWACKEARTQLAVLPPSKKWRLQKHSFLSFGFGSNILGTPHPNKPDYRRVFCTEFKAKTLQGFHLLASIAWFT